MHSRKLKHKSTTFFTSEKRQNTIKNMFGRDHHSEKRDHGRRRQKDDGILVLDKFKEADRSKSKIKMPMNQIVLKNLLFNHKKRANTVHHTGNVDEEKPVEDHVQSYLKNIQIANFEHGHDQFDVPPMKFTPKKKLDFGMPGKKVIINRQMQNALPPKKIIQPVTKNYELTVKKEDSQWSKIQKHMTEKFSNISSVTSLVEQRKIQKNIFDAIYQSFQEGKKLKRYDYYKREEMAKMSLTKIQEAQKKQNQEQMKNNQKIQSIYNNLVNAASDLYFQNKSSIFDLTFDDDNVTQRKQQLRQIKTAVKLKKMSVANANELILKRLQIERKQLKRSCSGNLKFKEFVRMIKKQHMEMHRSLNQESSERTLKKIQMWLDQAEDSCDD